MKTSRSKHLLEQALRAMPSDNSLRYARSTITRAINELVSIENKQSKKDKQSAELTPQERWHLDLESGTLTPPMTVAERKNSIAMIDQLISDEEEKIKEIKNSGPVKQILD